MEEEEGEGSNSSTSKGLWRYSGAHHSTSSFLPLLLSLPKSFREYQLFSAQSDQRERKRGREREAEGQRDQVRL